MEYLSKVDILNIINILQNRLVMVENHKGELKRKIIKDRKNHNIIEKINVDVVLAEMYNVESEILIIKDLLNKIKENNKELKTELDIFF